VWAVLLCLALVSQFLGCDHVRREEQAADPEWCDQAAFDAAFQRVKEGPERDVPAMAEWFKPYYRQLLDKCEDDVYPPLTIMAAHGMRWSFTRLLTIMREPNEGRRFWAAVIIQVGCNELCEEADGIIRERAADSKQMSPCMQRAVRLVLNPPLPAREAATESIMAACVGMKLEEWTQLDKRQKWRKLCDALGV
jgi:hypothetical protein